MSIGPETRAPFQPTRWTLIQQVREGRDDADEALETLCTDYWKPLHGWAVRTGWTPADAEDLVQGFFADVLRKRLFERADAAKGRLRTFLLTAFRRYARDVRAKAAASFREADRAISFEVLGGEETDLSGADSSPASDAFYDRQWALLILERALDQIRDDYTKRGKAADFTQLQRYLTEPGEVDYEHDASILGLSANAVKVAVHRLRERFRTALREEVASAQGPEADVDEELTYLVRALES